MPLQHEDADAVTARLSRIALADPSPLAKAQQIVLDEMRRIDPAASISETQTPPPVVPGMTLLLRDLTITATMTGWSPTLHADRITSSRSYRTRDDQKSGAVRLIEDFAPLIATQTARAKEGMRRWGRSEPLPSHTISATCVDHLHVDRALDALCRRTEWSAAARARRTVSSMCTSLTLVDAHHTRTSSTFGFMEEAPGPDPRFAVRSVGFLVHFDGRGGIDPVHGFGRPSFDGRDVVLPDASIPHTALSAVAGRPLGDLVRLHDELDGRIVLSAIQDSGGSVKATLATDPAPLVPTDHPTHGSTP